MSADGRTIDDILRADPVAADGMRRALTYYVETSQRNGLAPPPGLRDVADRLSDLLSRPDTRTPLNTSQGTTDSPAQPIGSDAEGMPQDTRRPLLSPEQAARRLGVSRRTVERRIESRRLPAIRVGERGVRIDPDDLDHFIASTEQAS